MKIETINIHLYSNGHPRYIGMNHKLYKIEECDDEEIGEAMNGGEMIPLMSGEKTESTYAL